MPKSGQQFIKENRAPRVHIAYEVETFGSRRKVELPFVMGVLSDLNGNAPKVLKDAKGEIVKDQEGQPVTVEKKSLSERDFEEFDMDNFEKKLEGIGPRLVLNKVENKLTAEGGNFSVDLTFAKMSDFEPGAIAEKVPQLRKLLDARRQLNDLMHYMDGKDSAQSVLDSLLKDRVMLEALANSAPKPDSGKQ